MKKLKVKDANTARRLSTISKQGVHNFSIKEEKQDVNVELIGFLRGAKGKGISVETVDNFHLMQKVKHKMW